MTKSDFRILFLAHPTTEFKIDKELFHEYTSQIKPLEIDNHNFYLNNTEEPELVILQTTESFLETVSIIQDIRQQLFDNSDIILITSEKLKAKRADFFKTSITDIWEETISESEITSKLNFYFKKYEALQLKTLQNTKATATALSAIQDAGEQANVIHFFQDSINCNTMEELGKLIVKSTNSFGYDNAVRLKTPWQILEMTTKEFNDKIDPKMFDHFSEMGRIYQLGHKLILNFDDIHQIVRDLPEDDDEICGRLRDHLALILDGAKARMKSLFMIEELKSLLDEINDSISNLKHSQHGVKENNVKIMDSMYNDFQNNIASFALSEQQEETLLQLVENYSQAFSKAHEEHLKLDFEMTMLASKLDKSIQHFIPNAK